MSAVVLSELYAGAHDIQSIKLLDKLYQTFRNVARLVAPDEIDWQQTGRTIASVRKKYGFETKYLARIQNDVLIACSARKFGAFVVTHNKNAFRRIQEFIDFHIYG